MERRLFLTSVTQAIASTVLARSVMNLPVTIDEKLPWQIQQFKDDGLAHFSYAIRVDKNIVLVDPGRDATQYYEFAKQNNAIIIGIVETHPHADFVSSHLEIAQTTGAHIYTSSLMKPAYQYKAFDEGQLWQLSDQVTLRSIYTPGHAPDAISVVLSANGKDKAVFTGDSLLIGDVGRPDLREYSGDVAAQRKKLAALMYQTIWQRFNKLDNEVVVYPAHGAGSLCGKNMRDAASSTIGYEKQHNYAFQDRTETAFVELLLSDLPIVPLYFPYDVALNMKGAPALKASLAAIPRLRENFRPSEKELILDVRSAAAFKASYLPGAYNLQNGTKFETWLGSVVAPDRQFYLVAGTAAELETTLRKAAKIGYESKITGAFVYSAVNGNTFDVFNQDNFNTNPSAFTIIDVRSEKEAAENKLFPQALNIPVNQLADRINNIPQNKPIVVHCASGYRSALGSSILKKYLPSVQIVDLGSKIADYQTKEQPKH